MFLAATAFALLDNFPYDGNFARLEFLTDPAYFIYRTISLDGLIIIFGLMFLLSGRMALDQKTGAKPLFLALNTLIYFIASPFDVSITSCIVPLIKTIFISALPISIFISFASVSLPAMMDVRLFYLLTSIFFIINAATAGSAAQMPFYLITSGDLVKLVWQHPKWPFTDMSSVFMNLAFLVGCGLFAWAFLHLKRNFWRAD